MLQRCKSEQFVTVAFGQLFGKFAIYEQSRIYCSTLKHNCTGCSKDLEKNDDCAFFFLLCKIRLKEHSTFSIFPFLVTSAKFEKSTSFDFSNRTGLMNRLFKNFTKKTALASL